MHEIVDHPPENGRFWNKVILVLQYFMSGTMISMLFTIVYTYQHLPSYNMVAAFSLIGIIPNFRFLLAPLIENHTSLSYGKRKTWMVIATVFKSVLVFVMSHFTRQDQQVQLGLIFIFAKTFLGIGRTSIDALALKQYKQKSRMSFLQTVVHKIGFLFGSLLFLKLISPTFFVYFGRSTPFLTVKQFFWIISVSLTILSILCHFLYKQDEWNTQQIIMTKSYCQLIKQYKVFFDLDNTYCRLIIFYFVNHLGFSCFTSGFRYALVQQYGFSRQTYVTITSLMFLTAIPLAYICSRSMKLDTIIWKLQLAVFLRLIFDILAFYFKLADTLHLCIYYFFSDNTKYFQSIILGTILNEISTVGLSGMFLSAAFGLRMVAQNHSWSLKLIDLFGFELCAIIGFIQQFIIIAFIPKLVQWVFDGNKPQQLKQTKTIVNQTQQQ